LIAGGSTVVLFASNTEWVFRSRKLALRALAVFTAVYAFIYVLLRVEAYALLVGAVVSFAAIAAAMYMTRNVDWYAGGDSARSVGSVAGGQGSVRESWLK
jgi:inner membrane protein